MLHANFLQNLSVCNLQGLITYRRSDQIRLQPYSKVLLFTVDQIGLQPYSIENTLPIFSSVKWYKRLAAVLLMSTSSNLAANADKNSYNFPATLLYNAHDIYKSQTCLHFPTDSSSSCLTLYYDTLLATTTCDGVCMKLLSFDQQCNETSIANGSENFEPYKVSMDRVLAVW
jgi:hypothetical protein